MFSMSDLTLIFCAGANNLVGALSAFWGKHKAERIYICSWQNLRRSCRGDKWIRYSENVVSERRTTPCTRPLIDFNLILLVCQFLGGV